MGVHSSFSENEDYFVTDSTVKVYVDENRIEWGYLGPPPPLPEKRYQKLLDIIHKYAPVFQRRPLHWYTTRRPQFDSAFEMAVRPDEADGSPNQGCDDDVDEAMLREGFLKFFVAILQNYRRFVTMNFIKLDVKIKYVHI